MAMSFSVACCSNLFLAKSDSNAKFPTTQNHKITFIADTVVNAKRNATIYINNNCSSHQF